MSGPNLDGVRSREAAASVDRALVALQLLRDRGGLRVTEAADELGVSASTAHRLLSALVRRDFAAQDEHRRYLPGPGLTAPHPHGPRITELLGRARPHLERLAAGTGESVNLMTRVGAAVRFLETVESESVPHVGGRVGTVLAARRTAGGRALLARLPRAELLRLHACPSEDGAPPPLPLSAAQALDADLDEVRRTGLAENRELSERGVVALGAAVPGRAHGVELAVSVSLPVTRADALGAAGLRAAVLSCCTDLAPALADGGPPST